LPALIQFRGENIFPEQHKSKYSKRFVKRTAAAVTIIVVAAAVFVFFDYPQCGNYTAYVNYTVGQIMVYPINNSGTNPPLSTEQLPNGSHPSSQSWSINTTDTQEVQAFDG
jgi:hypothetical protein